LDIFYKNEKALQADFDLLTERTEKCSQFPRPSLVPANIFWRKEPSVEYSILKATEGPYIWEKFRGYGEGNLIRGGFALCEKKLWKDGCQIYDQRTVGPISKVCGVKISNSVIFG